MNHAAQHDLIDMSQRRIHVGVAQLKQARTAHPLECGEQADQTRDHKQNVCESGHVGHGKPAGTGKPATTGIEHAETKANQKGVDNGIEKAEAKQTKHKKSKTRKWKKSDKDMKAAPAATPVKK